MADVHTMLLIAILVVLVLSLLARASAGSPSGLRRVERKLDAILGQLGIDVDAEVDPQVISLAREGRKIEAIKLYREQTGVGLKEAKEYVEGL